MIDKKIRDALFSEIHEAIEESAHSISELNTLDISYPPNVELTPDEKEALLALKLSDSAKSGLHKLVADACSYPLFHFFSLLDGVVDPDIEFDDIWLGASIEINTDDNDEAYVSMLHDEFFDSSPC